MTKPVERSQYYDLYFVVQKSTTGSFSLIGPGETINGTFLGTGVYTKMNDAQQEQTVQLLKGNRAEIFHIEYPVWFSIKLKT